MYKRIIIKMQIIKEVKNNKKWKKICRREGKRRKERKKNCKRKTKNKKLLE